MIVVGQKIGLEATITESGTAIDISGGSVAFDYWIPGNKTSTPDGSIEGTIESGPDGTVSGELPASINTSSGIWRFQASVTISGDTYRACATTQDVKPVGAVCS